MNGITKGGKRGREKGTGWFLASEHKKSSLSPFIPSGRAVGVTLSLDRFRAAREEKGEG